MKKLKIIPVLLFSAFLLFGCSKVVQSEETKAPEPIEISIPDPANYGFVMLKTPSGNHTIYSTDIDIMRDGKDGKSIYIVVDVANNSTWNDSIQ